MTLTPGKAKTSVWLSLSEEGGNKQEMMSHKYCRKQISKARGLHTFFYPVPSEFWKPCIVSSILTSNSLVSQVKTHTNNVTSCIFEKQPRWSHWPQEACHSSQRKCGGPQGPGANVWTGWQEDACETRQQGCEGYSWTTGVWSSGLRSEKEMWNWETSGCLKP